MARPVNPIPEDVLAELVARGLKDAYDARPHYQRNDYLGWITRAGRSEIRERRITQMLDELAKGGVYMGMDHPPSRQD